MAVALVSTAKTFLSCHVPWSNRLPSLHSSSFFNCKKNPVCRAIREPSSVERYVTKRSLGLSLIATLLLSSSAASATILEADEDDELMEKVKKDRQKRIQRQGVISSSKQETGYLQDVVYKLSKVGQAIDNNELNVASSVLGSNADTEWIKKANSAFNKISSSAEQKAEVESFNSSITKLISSVDNKDVDSSKVAFVSSAYAFEKWTLLTGLAEQLKGL